MRALVTGGAGFIGSTLVDALVGAGHEVVVVDDLSRGSLEQVPAGVELHTLDIRDPGLAGVVTAARPEVIFHEAAQIDVRRSLSEPLYDTAVNVDGTVNLLQAAVSAGARRVVFASSGGAIYGDTQSIPTAEDHPPSPASLYGAAKQVGEIYGNVYARLYGLEFVALRYANVYGPRQDPHGEAGVVAIFAERLLRGEIPVVNGDGLQTRDYVHVDDVVRANLATLDTPPGAYNIGTGTETDVLTVYRIVAAAAGRTDPPAHGPGKPGEQRRSCLAVARAGATLGWRPQTELEAGLTATVAWFQARPAHAPA